MKNLLFEKKKDLGGKRLVSSPDFTNFLFFISYFDCRLCTAPACHENMVKVGGYILGEFGNLVAGDPRSRYSNFRCIVLQVVTMPTIVYALIGMVTAWHMPGSGSVRFVKHFFMPTIQVQLAKLFH